MKKLPKGINMQTIFASGTMGDTIYMPLKWVIKNGNISQAITQTMQNILSAKSYKDNDFIVLLEKKLQVLRSLSYK